MRILHENGFMRVRQDVAKRRTFRASGKFGKIDPNPLNRSASFADTLGTEMISHRPKTGSRLL